MRATVSFRTWVVVFFACALLSGAPPAGAADSAGQPQSQWETPQGLDDARRRLDAVNQMTGDGTSVIHWVSQAGLGCKNWSAAVRRPGEAQWGEPVRLGRELAAAKIVVSGRHSVVAVLESCAGGITYRRLRADGWSRARPVQTSDGATHLDAVDVNERGTLVVTYGRDDLVEGVVHPRHGPWTALPPIKPGRYDSFGTADVDSEGRVTYVLPERDNTYRDFVSVRLYTLTDGAWSVERIKPPHDTPFAGLSLTFDERGSVSVAARTREGGNYRSELWVSVRPRGSFELTEPIQLGDAAHDVVGVSGGFDRLGRLTVAWAEEAADQEGWWTPLMSARDPGTGVFSSPKRLGSAGRQAFPDSDVARDGTVVIDVALADDKIVYVCNGIRRCTEVGSPLAPPIDTVDFEAGPDRSASVVLADEDCGDQDCWLHDIRGSYLASHTSSSPDRSLDR